MPVTEHDHFLIEQFLLNCLSPQEKLDFEQRLADSEFKEELDIQKDIYAAFQSSGRDEVKAGLQSLEAKIAAEPVKKIRNMPNWWLLAASMAALVTALIWIFQPSTTSSDLFAQYFEPYPNIVAPLQKSAEEVNPETSAYQAYEQKNYAQAIQLFEKQNTKSDSSNFYLGLSYLGKKDFKAATAPLEKIDEASSFYDPAKWYLALTYLEVGKIEQSKFLLRLIREDNNSPFKTKAMDLLSQIE